VTVRLTAGSGSDARQVLAHSRLIVAAAGAKDPEKGPTGGGKVRVPVPPGTQAQVMVRVSGPEPFRQALTVTVPPRLRVLAVRRGPQGVVVTASGPLRSKTGELVCGTDKVSFPSPTQAAVAKSPERCRGRLRLTARDGERAVAVVSVPSLPEIPLYSFASPAGRAIYITVDDGWTPSAQVLTIMRQTHLPVTAFLIAQAADRNLAYWRAFAAADGTIGDHTVSHPVMTKLTLDQAATQWGQARKSLGRWFGRLPVLGRPPYGAFNPTVEAAAYRGGLTTLVGWSATVSANHIETWNGKKLEAGEIVLLHWVPGLGHQLVTLLKAIHAAHLSPAPLTPASFTGQTAQQRSLDGD